MGVLDGRVAIVTGSNRGIGRGIARGFAREGARLALAARDAALLDDAADEFRSLGADVVAIPTDVTDEAAVDALIEQTLEQLGPLDVLVNNAGIAEHAPLVDMTLDAWQRSRRRKPDRAISVRQGRIAGDGGGRTRTDHQRGQHLVAALATGFGLV